MFLSIKHLVFLSPISVKEEFELVQKADPAGGFLFTVLLVSGYEHELAIFVGLYYLCCIKL